MENVLTAEAIRAALVRLAAGRCPLEGPFDIVEEGRLMRELVRLGYAREYHGWRTDNWGGHTITEAGRGYISMEPNRPSAAERG